MTAELVPTALRELPDTIKDAAATPSRKIPWKELGLEANKCERIAEILDRRPTNAELATYSVMWSEHCSYKSPKKHPVEQFGKCTSEEMKRRFLVGVGQNAGVVDIGDGWAVTFKVESHNHPSSVEPYQGAATEVGGIIRDIISMDAHPVAAMDQLRFDSVDHPDTAHIVHDVVFGAGGYGSCLDPPNVGRETEFDSSYQDNPLVSILRVGTLRREDTCLANTAGKSNLVILFGAHTGGDGIGGALILASETFKDGMPVRCPSVQASDPFMEEASIECCPGLFKAGVVQGIQDLGAVGISCVTLGLASSGDSGMHVNLEEVLLCDPSLTASEILMLESQKRMMAIVTPGDEERFFEIADKQDVEASIIGELTGDGHLTVDHFDHRIIDVGPETVAREGPVYDHPYARPLWQDELQANISAALARPSSSEELTADIMSVLTNISRASKVWVTDQYDRYVQGNTTLAQPDDVDVVRVDEESGLGVALATDASGWYAKLDPAMGTKQVLAKSYHNVAIVDAEPIAITDCLNFDNPEDTGVMWQLVTAMTALASGYIELSIPVTGSNMLLYGSSGAEKNLPNSSINPTPVIGMLGIMEGVSRVNPSSSTEEGLAVVLLDDTHDEFDGSMQTHTRHNRLGGLPPQIDLSAEAAFGNVVRALSTTGDPQGRPLIRTAHDLSNGGLTQSLVDVCLHFGVGGSFGLSETAGISGLGDFEMLSSGSQGRALIAVRGAALPVVYAAAEAESVRATRIGMNGGELLAVLDTDLLEEGEKPWITDLGELRVVSEVALKDRF